MSHQTELAIGASAPDAPEPIHTIESYLDDVAYNTLIAILAGVDLNLGEQQ